MNHEDMSDYTLNYKLTRLWMIEKFGVDRVRFDKSSKVFRVEGNNGYCKIKDYCTDWNATMPLAFEHGLSVEFPDSNLGGVGQITKYMEGATDIETHLKSSDNPLRAIVICLIKVLEAK